MAIVQFVVMIQAGFLAGIWLIGEVFERLLQRGYRTGKRERRRGSR
jgi:hypothetical protein